MVLINFLKNTIDKIVDESFVDGKAGIAIVENS